MCNLSIEISSLREETDSDRDVPLGPDGDVLAGAAEQQLLQGLPQGGLQEQLQQGQQDGVAIADVHADLAQILLSLHSNTFILLTRPNAYKTNCNYCNNYCNKYCN